MKATKRCSKCGEYKSVDEFCRDKHQLSGLSCSCKKCHNKQGRESDAVYRENRKARTKKYHQEHLEQDKARRHAHYIRNWERIAQEYELTARGIRLQKYYNMTLDDYDAMLKTQNNQCVICGKTPEENGKRLCVDHDHETGAVRGLLCDKCNTGLGFFRDSIDLVSRAKKYLKGELL
jgi:hypothetical protein